MAIQKLHIEQFLSLVKDCMLIDVRSPGEYNHARIPGAHSLPLFTDEERKIVGTAYKQESREAAIKIGLDFFGPKMRKMVEEIQGIRNWELGIGIDGQIPNPQSPIPSSYSKSLLIYCWRGGMRSAGVAWLMDLYGFKVYTLIGGYKSFRNYVLSTFKLPFRFNILGGLTGAGKTEVLKELERGGDRVVDLEDIAKHKGSAFGSIGMPKQPSQEMFENLLAWDLRKKLTGNGQLPVQAGEMPDSLFALDYSRSIWLEDESQRIGLVNIPNDLWQMMRLSPVYFLDVPFEQRLDHIVREYGCLDKEQMGEAILRIQKRLGGVDTKNALLFLEEGNMEECFRILLKYYDKHYLKGLHNRDNIETLLLNIQCTDVNAANAEKIQHHIHENH